MGPAAFIFKADGLFIARARLCRAALFDTVYRKNKIKAAIELFEPYLCGLSHKFSAANKFAFVNVFALNNEQDRFE
jgi:hypothetical protein